MSSGEDGLKLAAAPNTIPRAKAAYFDSLDKGATNWVATGWAVDPKTKEPALFVFPLQGEAVLPNTEFRRMLRPDVNAHLKMGRDKITGFTVSFSPGIDSGLISLVAVLPSGELVRLPPPHRISSLPAEPPEEKWELEPASDEDPAWERHWASPMYRFPPDSSFRGIYAFHAAFNAREAGGVTEQFLADADVYHRKYSSYSRWSFLLSQALSQAGMANPDERPLSVLDVGSGSGNTILPLLKMLPNSKIVATDISPQLLAILRDSLSEADRQRVRLIAMDNAEHRFAAEAFDLVVGGAILHHILDPSQTLKACHSALIAGGTAIFFEPFEEGFVMLRLLYEQLLEHSSKLRIKDQVAKVLRAIVIDVDVRTGSDKSSSIFQAIDDKWLFTRTYFQSQKESIGFSELGIHPLDTSASPFSSQTAVPLTAVPGCGGRCTESRGMGFCPKLRTKILDRFPRGTFDGGLHQAEKVRSRRRDSHGTTIVCRPISLRRLSAVTRCG